MVRKKNDDTEFSSYPVLLESVKEKIKTAQLEAALAVNSELVSLCWEIGLVNYIEKLILELGQGFAFIGRQYHLEIAGATAKQIEEKLLDLAMKILWASSFRRKTL